MKAYEHNERGLRLLENGRVQDAEAAFRQALQADPFSGPAHCNLGAALLQECQPFDAVWHLRYACQLLPKASQPRANLGPLYEAAGRYGLAEEQLRAALALSPEDIEIIGSLARVSVRQGKRTQEALTWLETTATQDDDEAWRVWARRELARINDESPGK